MTAGDVNEVTTGECSDLYYVDTGMYGTAEYGAVYVLDAAEVALVDTGIGTHHDRVLDALDELDIAPEAVDHLVVTHVHLDHAGGAGFLADACENATVWVHERGARHLADPSRLWEGTKAAVGDQIDWYTEPQPVPEERIETLADGDTIDLGDRELHAAHAPGHAPHQHVFHDPANDAVFTADAAGIYVPSLDLVRETSPPPQFDLEQALADVETIRSFEPSTLLYPHFGPAATDDRLTEYEARLESWVAEVAAKRDELGDDEAVVEHFAETTEMAEVWGERKASGETAMNVRGVLRYLDSRDD
ncbi:MBL fold metallo-hydrolase [Haloarchaeobius salinus]|uniref:MBL fold metallo-hydrolase n=1 Tax=Haloarchaeobius salinus TaxID=1198298 RepID=UPI00210C209D|nr:MBL fold metallo-hydrolase [Haloarchaeobius salinus]